MDADIVSDLRDDLTNDRESKDGLNRRLFPLTAEEQRKYSFRLAGDAHKIPLLVRTALGTNLHGLGFSVRYQKFDGGHGFPSVMGRSFACARCFFYRFQRAKVSSRIEFTAPSVSAGTVSPESPTPR